MKKIGVTGSNGFVGKHVVNTLSLFKEKYEIVPFERAWFDDSAKLDEFIYKTDCIVHLAALNRHNDDQVIYQTNIQLVDQLVDALARTKSKAQVILSSSTQELNDNIYGNSKKLGRERLAKWAQSSEGTFCGMVIPNVFGPFGHPMYNSVVATFCHLLISGESPEVHNDSVIRLIYVGELVNHILNAIDANTDNHNLAIPYTSETTVTRLLAQLENYKTIYFDKGEIPELQNDYDHNLFNTFRSFIDPDRYFPRKLMNNIDNRGNFVEVIRLGIGGQCSFSTTVPGITRGNHFHTRKIERFTVIQGEAKIELRRIDQGKISSFFLSGKEPSYVDMPIWYTHNITNVGDAELLTLFWINEAYDPENPDTYFVTV